MTHRKTAKLSMTMSTMLLLSQVGLASEVCLKPMLEGIDQADIECAKTNFSFYNKDTVNTAMFSIFKQE